MKIYFIISRRFDDRTEYVIDGNHLTGTSPLHALTFTEYQKAESFIRDVLPIGVYQIEKLFVK